MPQPIQVIAPFREEAAAALKAGDVVSNTGHLLTGRHAAQKRLIDLLRQGQALPVELQDQTIYYVGAAPAKPGCTCGPAGPTTS